MRCLLIVLSLNRLESLLKLDYDGFRIRRNVYQIQTVLLMGNCAIPAQLRLVADLIKASVALAEATRAGWIHVYF